MLLAVCLVVAALVAGCADYTDSVRGDNPAAVPVADESEDRTGPEPPALSPEIPAAPAETGDDPGPAAEADAEPDREEKMTPAPPAAEKGPEVTLLVTRDYGATTLFREEVRLEEGDTVLDVLKRSVTVETAYGGGFLESIDGLASRSSWNSAQDWLFWVNGVSSALGAADFKLRPGDHVWWDYQDWAGGSPVTAVVGAYPQPFVSGHRQPPGKTVVLYAPGDKVHAEAVAGQLTGQEVQVTLSAFREDLIKHRKHPTIVVGTWLALRESATLTELNQRMRRAGLFMTFKDAQLLELASSGQVAASHGAGTGAVLAVGSRPGDQAPLWVISGVDADGLAAAVRVFTEEPSAMAGAFALVVDEGGAIHVPR